MAAAGKVPSPNHTELPRPRYAEDSIWYVCQVCGNKFENRYALMGHMNTHRKPPPVVRCIRLFGVDIIVEVGPDGVAEKV
jgi:hypothetical protein